MHKPQHARRSGFTLLELSIVLVIVALITGGVLVGRDLIRAAQVQMVFDDAKTYANAIQLFKDKYGEHPGDYSRATEVWGSAGGPTNSNDITCYNAQSASSPAVCNGNGNGRIGFKNGVINDGPVDYCERFYAWKHLANAGMIRGSYTGYSVTGTGSSMGTSSVDSPPTPVPNTFYQSGYVAAMSGNSELFDGEYEFNSIVAWGTNNSSRNALTPLETMDIDTKFDDGRPATGKIFATKQTGTWMPNCTTSDIGATAQYNVGNSAQLCNFWMAVDAKPSSQ